MKNDYKIRYMAAGDFSQMLALWKNTPGMGLNPIDDSEASINAFIVRNKDYCFVAEYNGQVIATIMAGNDGRRGHVYHLVVDTAHRHKGIAGELVKHVEDALRKDGIIKITLVAFAENGAGNAFWEQAGYTTRSDLVYRNKAL
jgi:ribosomal protein S18 acetylase RimI-like enzyme